MIEAISAISPFLSKGEGIKQLGQEKTDKHPFEVMLDRAANYLEGVSSVENEANAATNQYLAGKIDLSDAMLATSKMGIVVQMAVTTVTTSVNTFKEITQMQI